MAAIETDLGPVVGPQGPKGETGATGPQGPQGKSAYQIWLAQSGNAGKTEAEFLVSLKGETGEKGATGAQGPAGPKGEDITSIIISSDTPGSPITGQVWI